jgi:hypothetical protein
MTQMYLVTVTLIPDEPRTDLDVAPATLVDRLKAATESADRIEHVSVRASANFIDIGFFHLAPPSPASAIEGALRVVRRIVSPAAPLHGWHLSIDPVQVEKVPSPDFPTHS